MEQERLALEKEEAAKAEKAKKIKEEFGDANGQWEKDKSEMQNMASKDKTDAVPPAAPPAPQVDGGKAQPGKG